MKISVYAVKYDLSVSTVELLNSLDPERFDVCLSCEPKPGESGVRSVLIGERIPDAAVGEPDPAWAERCRIGSGIICIYYSDRPNVVDQTDLAAGAANQAACGWVVLSPKGLREALDDVWAVVQP